MFSIHSTAKIYRFKWLSYLQDFVNTWPTYINTVLIKYIDRKSIFTYLYIDVGKYLIFVPLEPTMRLVLVVVHFSSANTWMWTQEGSRVHFHLISSFIIRSDGEFFERGGVLGGIVTPRQTLTVQTQLFDHRISHPVIDYPIELCIPSNCIPMWDSMFTNWWTAFNIPSSALDAALLFFTILLLFIYYIWYYIFIYCVLMHLFISFLFIYINIFHYLYGDLETPVLACSKSAGNFVWSCCKARLAPSHFRPYVRLLCALSLLSLNTLNFSQLFISCPPSFSLALPSSALLASRSRPRRSFSPSLCLSCSLPYWLPHIR